MDPFTVPQVSPPPQGMSPPGFGPTNINPWGVSMGNEINVPQPQSTSQAMAPFQVPMPTDPYSADITAGQNLASGYADAYNSAAPGMQNNINQSTGAMNAYGNQGSSYPSYPNSAGAGTQTAGMSIPQAQSQPMIGSGQMGAGTMQQTQDTTTGFSPWSLQGEALTRK